MLNLETILDGNPKFLAGEFSALELSNIKLIELDPVGGVLTGGLHVGRPSLWAKKWEKSNEELGENCKEKQMCVT